MRKASLMLSHLRATGADLPWSDLRRGHAAALDGYFWRLTDPSSGRVIVALCGVCRDRAGRGWANLALAAHPGGFQRDVCVASAGADTSAYRVWADGDGGRLRADAEHLEIDLGPDARLTATFSERRDLARPFLGGVGIAQMVPGLGQYWHPHLLGAQVSGTAVLSDERVSLDGASVYAEHNWGAGGFPERWWWGQAQAFAADPEACVAFAGGEVTVGPGRIEATAVMVAAAGARVRFGNPALSPVKVSADGTRWSLRGRSVGWSVELEGTAGGTAHVLPIPVPHERRSVPGAHEHLAAELALTLRRRGRTVFSGTSQLAGLEVGTAPQSTRPAGPEDSTSPQSTRPAGPEDSTSPQSTRPAGPEGGTGAQYT